MHMATDQQLVTSSGLFNGEAGAVLAVGVQPTVLAGQPRHSRERGDRGFRSYCVSAPNFCGRVRGCWILSHVIRQLTQAATNFHGFAVF